VELVCAVPYAKNKPAKRRMKITYKYRDFLIPERGFLYMGMMQMKISGQRF